MTTSEIVTRLRITPEEFEYLFMQAQSHLPVTSRMWFKTVAKTALGAEALQLGLDFAQANQFLDQLLLQIVSQERADATLTTFVLKKGGETSSPLQSILDAAQGFDDPLLMAQRLSQGAKWVCKIHIDDLVCGTGVLIKPNLVLTAYHVVEKLFVNDPANPQGPKIPDKTAGPRLKAEFDNVFSFQSAAAMPQLAGGEKIGGHPANWYVGAVPCHPLEFGRTLPDPLTDLGAWYDFAVIRLARPIGYERRWASLNRQAVVPTAGQPVLVFQHPAGQPLKTCTGKITDPSPPNLHVFPKLRFLHKTNTLPGSSGGPCFDKDFQLIGLHQGEWPLRIKRSKVNRGVPITGICEHLNELPDPDVADSPVWTLGEAGSFAPVLGCDAFQAAIWKSVMDWKERAHRPTNQPAKQLFVLDSTFAPFAAKRAGSGKTFRTNVLTAMLPPSDHLLITLPAETIAKQSAVELAATIIRACGLEPLRTEQPIDTTNAALLGPDVWAPLLSALTQARQQRLVWLVLTDLNKINLDGQQTTDLLTLLYEQVKTLDWLRIVLDGMRGSLNNSLIPYLEPLDTPELTDKDVASYYRKFLAAKNMTIADAAIDLLTSVIAQDYQDDLLNAPDTANVLLVERVMRTTPNVVRQAQRM